MEVTVRLFAGLRERAGSERVEVELPEGASVADLLAALADTPVGALRPGQCVVAINREYARADAVVGAGDEVALIPPVSGGASGVRLVEVTGRALDLAAVSAAVRDARAGAIVCFEGVTREVDALDYEAYAEMAEPRLRAIAAEEAARPRRHRTGETLSARNRFTGTVRSVEVDGVMALVEIEAGPFLVTAAVTRDAVEELGLREGVEAVATVKATSVMVERPG